MKKKEEITELRHERSEEMARRLNDEEQNTHYRTQQTDTNTETETRRHGHRYTHAHTDTDRPTERKTPPDIKKLKKYGKQTGRQIDRDSQYCAFPNRADNPLSFIEF